MIKGNAEKYKEMEIKSPNKGKSEAQFIYGIFR